MALSTARSNRLRRGAVLAGSLAAHIALLGVLALPQPALFPDRSDDEGALSVTLERPRQDADQTLTSPPAPDRPVTNDAPAVRPRAARLTPPASVAPLGLGPVAGKGVARHPAPLPEGPRGDLRSALRGSGVGCANAAALGLNRRERERCEERWGEAARKAPVYADAPMDPDKRAGFDQQAARQAAYRRYLDAPMGPGVDHRSRDGPGKAKDIPFVMGNTDGIGRQKSDASLGIKP